MKLIKNAKIKTMAGTDIPCGMILISDDGKIAKIGAKFDFDAEACEIIDAEGRLTTPGLIDAHDHAGIDDTAVRWEGADHNEYSDPITPHLRAIDGIYPQDEAFANAVAGGLTAACIGPGSANVVGGSFAVVKLSGVSIDDMTVKSPAAMKCAFGENPKGAYGQNGRKAPYTRMGVAAMLRELLFKSKKYLEDKESGKDVAFDMKLEAMIPVIKGEIPLKAHAHRADDILTAVRIAKEFGVKLTLDHCTDGSIVAKQLGEAGFPAIVGPTITSKTKRELVNKSFDTLKDLYNAGVEIAIITDAPVIPLERLPLCAAMAVGAGLPEEEGWRAITSNPAKFLGVDDRIGTLEEGKDADIVIWSDDPLHEVCAAPVFTLIDGKIVYSKESKI